MWQKFSDYQRDLFIIKKLVIKSGVIFLTLFVLVDTILQKVGYFKNKSGTFLFFGFMHVSYGNN